MSKVIEYLKGIMSDETDSPSFKRYLSLACFIVSIVIAFTTQNTGNIYAFLGLLAVALGLTTTDKFTLK